MRCLLRCNARRDICSNTFCRQLSSGSRHGNPIGWQQDSSASRLCQRLQVRPLVRDQPMYLM